MSSKSKRLGRQVKDEVNIFNSQKINEFQLINFYLIYFVVYHFIFSYFFFNKSGYLAKSIVLFKYPDKNYASPN